MIFRMVRPTKDVNDVKSKDKCFWIWKKDKIWILENSAQKDLMDFNNIKHVKNIKDVKNIKEVKAVKNIKDVNDIQDVKGIKGCYWCQE